MALFLQLIIPLIVITSTAAVYYRILPIKEKVSCSTVMLAAMGIGSMNGLLTGTILGLTHSYGLNSILSMIVGISTGIILGLMFNYMTTIEGIFGGVMGGLMGAMLGEMLVSEYIYTISLLLIVVMGLFIVLLIKHIGQEVQYKHDYANLKNINLNKLTLIIVFSSLILFTGILLGSGSPSENEHGSADLSNLDIVHHE